MYYLCVAGCPNVDVCRQAVSQFGSLTIDMQRPSSPSGDTRITQIKMNFDTKSIPPSAELRVGLELVAVTNALVTPSSFVDKTIIHIFGSQLGRCPAGRVINLD